MGPAKSHKLLEHLSCGAAECNYVRGGGGHECTLMFTFRKTGKMTASSRLSVHPSACMEELGSHSTDFNEIVYLHVFRISDESGKVS